MESPHPAIRQPWFVRSDIDGFLGLALDNLIQFLLILGLCAGVLQFDSELILGTILPGAALSLVLGNVFYAVQARRLAERTGRDDVTALPYGINTVSLFAYIFLVMLPAEIGAAKAGLAPEAAQRIAWQVGLAACLVSGLIEMGGAFVADWIRRVTPRAALLSTLAGIAISFISIDFALRTFEIPLIAFLPLAIILATYFAGIRMPLGIPGGVWAVAAGAAAAWGVYVVNQVAGGSLSTPVDPANVRAGLGAVGFRLPLPVLGDLYASFADPYARSILVTTLVSVMLPMGLFNVLGSLQNLESAEAAGDAYPTRPSLLVNGAGSIVAACFGSCFPTTIYIGHPGWKAMGARSGYSLLNGVVFAIIALFGLTGLIAGIVPKEAGMAIVLYIGIVITAQAFQATPRHHAPAVAIGLFPAIAAWGALLMTWGITAAGIALDPENRGVFETVMDKRILPQVLDFRVDGLVALSAGFMLTCMVWAAIAAHLIDRQFIRALWWALAAAALSTLGFMHVGNLTSSGVEQVIADGRGWPWGAGYLMVAGFIAVLHIGRAKQPGCAPGPADC